MKTISSPPPILVKTWVHNLKNSDDMQVKTHAKNMLLAAFGDMRTAAEYIKTNRIEV